jgi:hypothetical protein
MARVNGVIWFPASTVFKYMPSRNVRDVYVIGGYNFAVTL